MGNKTLKVNFGILECTEETFVWSIRIAVNNRFFEEEYHFIYYSLRRGGRMGITVCCRPIQHL